jgi:hypothetical protein
MKCSWNEAAIHKSLTIQKIKHKLIIAWFEFEIFLHNNSVASLIPPHFFNRYLL